MFEVQSTPLNLKKREATIADPSLPGFSISSRVCHHSATACCRGFWNRSKDAFALGQITQRLRCVVFVQHTLGKVEGV